MLLGASIWYAVSQQNAENWPALGDVEPALLLALFVSIFLSTIFLPGLQFWLVTQPFVTGQRLSVFTMQGLTAGSALLNYTPVKAGLIGRVAYLRYFHGVGLRAAVISHTLIVIVFVAACGITFLVTLWRPQIDIGWVAAIITAFLIAVLVGAPLLGLLVPLSVQMDPEMRHSRKRQAGFLGLCFLIQGLGLAATTVRWWLVFAILDRPATFTDAWLAAVVHMVTIAGGPANGLGFREWLIGLAGQRGLFSPGLQIDLGAGVAAALFDRAVESIVIVAFGLFGLALLRRGLRAQKSAAEQGVLTEGEGSTG